MKKLISILALFGFSLLSVGNVQQYHSVVARKKADAGGVTYLVDEGFEGTGYENSWTENLDTGIIDEDYTTTVLTGTESLALSTNVSKDTYTRISFTAAGEIWARMQFSQSGSPGGGRDILRFRDASDNALGTLQILPSGVLRIGTTDTVGTVSDNTTYNLWVRIKKGTGSNGEMSAAFSTTGTEPTSGNDFVEITNGSFTADIAKFEFRINSNALTTVWDELLINDSAIGDL